MIKEVVAGGRQRVYQLTYNVPTKVVPPVNGFLILADVPILIDGGASDEETYQEFHKDLATLGLKASDLGAVIVTHNHVDHIGLASRLAADNPALKVQVHE
ncbi:MAG: MBL fold metallo-hydrolase, partial [Bdellovibrionia bacterium]